MSAKGEEELCSFDLISAKMSDVQKLTVEVHDLLRQDLEKVRQERVAFDELTKTLNAVHFSKAVKVNVGGKIYKTTLDTLRRDPNSMLCAMFSGRHELKADEEDGAYFIDRDGKLFRYILNYLRNGELFFQNDLMMKKELLAEARFYQVQGIIDILEGKTLKVSTILKNESHQSAIHSWLPEGASYSLLYRVTTDGSKPQDFHRCCDNKGPTLVVVQNEEFIFGGYTSKSWQSPSTMAATADDKSFLFTLVNPSGNEPVKLSAKPKYGGIRCRNDIGPRFGTSDSNDLCLWQMSPSISFTGGLNLGNGFSCPQGKDKNTFFTGRSPFDINELEVFKVRI